MAKAMTFPLKKNRGDWLIAQKYRPSPVPRILVQFSTVVCQTTKVNFPNEGF